MVVSENTGAIISRLLLAPLNWIGCSTKYVLVVPREGSKERLVLPREVGRMREAGSS